VKPFVPLKRDLKGYFISVPSMNRNSFSRQGYFADY